MTITYRSPRTKEEFENYYKFRWNQLRKPLGLERGSEQDELEKYAFHIAAFDKNDLIGVGRIQLEQNSLARIRYMAVESRFRNRGIGSKLLKKLEIHALSNNINLCWLLAREEAVPFYEKNNYEISGTAHSELQIPHLRMQKLIVT